MCTAAPGGGTKKNYRLTQAEPKRVGLYLFCVNRIKVCY